MYGDPRYTSAMLVIPTSERTLSGLYQYFAETFGPSLVVHIVKCCKCGRNTRLTKCPKCKHQICTSCKEP